MLAGEIERRLSELEDRIARLDMEQQRAWALVLDFLKEQRHGARMEQARLDRAIVGLKGEDSSPENPCRKGPSVV